ncbi:MAG: DNA-formamidopyrimidine glycosylase family protein [Betaproteobacteria bacterium]
MPELPDLEAYRHALAPRIVGRPIARIVVSHPFLLRTAVPPIEAAVGREVVEVRRLGKRIVLALERELFLVIHLMIAGRLRWIEGGAKPPARITLATFAFADGVLALTEAGTKRRASLHVVEGEDALATLDPGGVEPLDCDLAGFVAILARGNHTLKRALTDPHAFAGIGNAYSDEILHRAKRSPLALTSKLAPEDVAQLYTAMREVLVEWTSRLSREAEQAFPRKVTAFRPEMAVHGRFGKPCPVCGAPVQRIVYAENECNYCARCQTGGRILADRALSRLLKASFPRTLDEG